MQKLPTDPRSPSSPRSRPARRSPRTSHGGRAKCLQRLMRLEMPVPRTVALSISIRCARISRGPSARHRHDDGLLRHRSAALGPAVLGGSRLGRAGRDPQHRHERRAACRLVESHGETAANALYLRFIQAYAVHVARLDPDVFEPAIEPTAMTLRRALAGLRGRDGRAVSAGLVRTQLGRGAALDGAGLGGHHRPGSCARPKGRRPMPVSVSSCRRWRLGLGRRHCGSGVIQFVDGTSGQPGDHRPLHEPGPGSRRAHR